MSKNKRYDVVWVGGSCWDGKFKNKVVMDFYVKIIKIIISL